MDFTNEQIEFWQGEVATTLVKSKFLAWVKRKEHSDVLGVRKDCAKCILALYLQETLPHLDCQVGLNHVFCSLQPITGYCSDRLYYLGSPLGDSPDVPQWVQRFIERIDGMPVGTAIYKQEALDALNFV